MRRDLPYFATLILLILAALPADLAAMQALPLGSGMQLLLATGLAGLTALAAHVGAKTLTDLIDIWSQRHRVPWRFWLELGQAAAVIGGTLGMLAAFGLLRGDTLGVIGELTDNQELRAAGWKINAALFGLQFVCFIVALVLGIKRLQGLRRVQLERELRELDKRIAEAQRQAESAARTIVAADNTVAKLDRELVRQREQIEAWAVERHKRTDYHLQKQRIRAEKRQHRLALRETTVVPPDQSERTSKPHTTEAAGVHPVEPGDVIDAVADHARRGNHAHTTDWT